MFFDTRNRFKPSFKHQNQHFGHNGATPSFFMYKNGRKKKSLERIEYGMIILQTYVFLVREIE